MFSKFSVQKPLTVFVSVLMVIILGFVSFTSMTPDLLPGINLPYAVVVTAYPGATPEEVELKVSKPLEEQMASLEDIAGISSTSSDSVSMIVLEFNESANMDTMVGDIREKINGVSGSWDDFVQTPYIMKINPDLLPIVVSAVEYGEKSSVEITNFINDELLSELEGITGVASVDISGGVTEQVNVLLSQNKIDALNEKIKKSLDDKFSEAEDEINDGKTEISDGKDEINSNKSELDNAQGQLESGQETLLKETSKAQAELVSQKVEIASTKQDLEGQIASIEANLPLLETTVSTLKSLRGQYTDAKAKLDELNKKLETATDEEKLQINQEKIPLDAILTSVDLALGAMGYSIEDIDKVIADNENNLAMAKDGIAQMQEAIVGLEKASGEITKAMEELNKQQLSGAMEITAGLAQISSAKSALDQALTQLDSAETEIDKAKEQLEEQKELAYKSANMNITMDMVSQLLVAQNFSMPVGYITEDDVDYLIRVGEEINSLEELQNLMLFDTGIDEVGTVKLTDVADVFITDNTSSLYSKVNGHDSLMLSFSKQSSYATKTVTENVAKKFEQLEKEYEGLNFSDLSNQGDMIDIVVNTVLSNMIYGGILAVLILILFLKDLRPTLIIAFSIPISILLAITLMYFSGITLNIISLSGLAIGVGMLVDNSVVVIENIHRMRSEGTPILKASVQGASQVAGAITASTLTTVCVFLPIVFIEGLTRQLFQDMALTVGYSLLASLIIALTLVPAMASSMLKKEKVHKEGFMNVMVNAYGKVATASLKHNWVVLVIAIAMLVLSTAMVLIKGFIFMPSMSGLQITINVTAPEEATFEEKTQLADDIYEQIRDVAGIETFGITVKGDDGSSSGFLSISSMSKLNGSSSSSGDSDITIYGVISTETNRKQNQITDDILENCKDLDCEIKVSGSMDMSSMMTAMGGEGVSVSIYGQDLDALIEEANLLADKLSSIEGVSEVSTGLEDANPELRIIVDQEKAIKEGLTVAQVYGAVTANVTAETTGSDIMIDGINTDLVIKSEKNSKLTVDGISDMILSYNTMQGEAKEIELSEIAEIVETESLNSISRVDQRRTLSVSAKIDPSYNVTIVSDKVNAELRDYECLAGNTINVGGESEMIMEAIEQLALMMILAIVIIYFIMVAQFQSFKLPFIVMFTIPLAFTGGFLALLITGYEMSVISMVGFVMLSGIIVNNGIVLIDYINVLRYEGVEKKEAIVLAGKTRMRPILMTALTTILGLVFMALGTGVGSEMMQPMAIVCIGGLIYATLMTLFVVPAMYDILSSKKMEKRIVD